MLWTSPFSIASAGCDSGADADGAGTGGAEPGGAAGGDAQPVLASVGIGLLFTLMMLTQDDGGVSAAGAGVGDGVQLWSRRRT